MKEQQDSAVENNGKPGQTDEIGGELETGNDVNAAIEKQGNDATAGILRDTDAAKQQHKREEADNGDQ